MNAAVRHHLQTLCAIRGGELIAAMARARIDGTDTATTMAELRLNTLAAQELEAMECAT